MTYKYVCVIYVQTESRSCSELDLLDGGDVYLRLHLTVWCAQEKEEKARDDQKGRGAQTKALYYKIIGLLKKTKLVLNALMIHYFN